MSIRLTIFNKGLILVAISLLWQLLFIFLVSQLLQGNAEVQGWVTHTKEVIAQAHVVQGSLARAEAYVRGLTVTSDPTFAEEYERAAKRIPKEFASLRELVADNSEQIARAASAAEKADRLMAWLAETKRLLSRGTLDRTAVRARSRDGETLMEDCLRAITAFLGEEERLEAERRRNVERSQRQLRILLLVGSGVAILLTLVLAFSFRRGISRRFAILTANAQRLGQGRELLPPLADTDEIAQVDDAFHLMARQLARIDNAMRAQKQILQSVLEGMAEGVVVADEKGKFLLFNPSAERILGVGSNEASPDAWSEYYRIHLPDKKTPCPTEQLPLVQAIQGKSVDAAELWVAHPEIAEGVWISLNARPLHGDDGTRQGGLVVFHDISQSKRAEEMLQRLNEELEYRIEERTRELTAANRSLAQKNQENELFVYSVSHDLRSPLVNLEGFSEELSLVCQDLCRLVREGEMPVGLRERAIGLLDEDMSESIRFIRAGVRRLSNIIDGLLRLSRAGRVEHHCRQVEIKPIIQRIVDSLHVTIVERQATVTVADLLSVWADPTAVEQIFANLIGNALNYLASSRPGVIEIGAVDAPSKVSAKGQPALRTFYVKDNGLGIPAAYQPKVFQAFQRLHPTAAKGEGIGLTLVRRLIERLGGSIWFESVEGVGTTFFVTLPETPPSGTLQSIRPDAVIIPEPEQAHDNGPVLHSAG